MNVKKPSWEERQSEEDVEELTPVLHQVYLGCFQRDCTNIKRIAQQTEELIGTLWSVGTVTPFDGSGRPSDDVVSWT